MNQIIIFDSCVLIDTLRGSRHLHQIISAHARVRHSSVALAELWRGARTKADFDALHALQKRVVIVTPTEKNWIESGEILAKMRSDHGFEPAKLRDLHFDMLIALTARSHGACLITSNRADFELIRGYRDFELEIW
jgi:predicted nucleic acid-binding protein